VTVAVGTRGENERRPDQRAQDAGGDGVPRAPGWVREADRALAYATAEAPLLAYATPRAGLTRAAIITAFEKGEPRSPRWEYAQLEAERAQTIAAALESMAGVLGRREPAPLAQAYAARARETALEGILSSIMGAREFGARAKERFEPGRAGSAEASALAAAWVTTEVEAAPSDRVCTSDGHEASSLASRLRQEVGRLRLPYRVVPSSHLAALAATGDRVILVATGRKLTTVDVERTVLHEIQAHALPRHRASTLLPGLFAIGTARGNDDQEGLALALEERHGFLVGARRRELALRHRAVEAMDAGATFVEAVRTLLERDGASIPRAVVACERAFRGSDGETAGLGRERVYLSGYVRVAARLRERPGDERVLASGQVAVDAIEVLEPFVPMDRSQAAREASE
jgi:hypothetical protein